MTSERAGDGSVQVGSTDQDRSSEDEDGPILAVEDLETHFPVTAGWLRREVARVRAVDGVSFRVDRGETVGLVGESGCGKTTTALSVLDLVERTGGEVRFDGTPIQDLTPEGRRSFRRRAQLVVQDPDDAFNPRMTVGTALAEPLAVHGVDDPDRRRAIVEETLDRLGLSRSVFDRYPHEFSGGEKQRLAIARALVLDPDLLVADEPTSALDGRVRENVLDLLADIRATFGVAVLIISHDIDVVRRFCDRVAVMYLGEIVERGPTQAVIESPTHPYTRVLIGSVPSLDPDESDRVEPLTETVPDSTDPPSGCRFHTRCPELIPPDETDLSQETWRSVAGFRFTLEDGSVPEGLDPDDSTVRAGDVREAFGLPAQIDDPAVEELVGEAARQVARGELERAADVLESLPTSPCERRRPETITWDGREVRCHRYDDDIEASPIPWSDDRGL